MYTHFTFTLMAHCTSGAIRGSVSCSRTLRQGIATFCLLNDFFISCTTVAPKRTAHMQLNMIHMNTTHLITAHLNTAHLTSVLPTNSLYLGVPPRYINNHKSIFGDFRHLTLLISHNNICALSSLYPSRTCLLCYREAITPNPIFL